MIERILAHIPQLIAALPVALLVVLITIFLNLVTGRTLRMLARRTHLSEADVQPVVYVVRWLVRIIAVIMILGVLGFELGGIWAMISTVLGLVAIGFVAVWSLLSNASSTVLILFLRPFQIGDDLEIAGEPVSGRVVDLNFFYTTLIDSDGRLLQVPNNQFFQKTVKRRRNTGEISLAQQLNSSTPAALLPPAKPEALPATPPKAP
ncbi:MAG TPA: mechanosensitive ion channel domain-containing protein [Opitutaceae bacterium]